MKLIHQVLKQMHENYAVFFPPCEALTIQKLSVALVKNGFSKIPTDYLSFLQETDGLSYNGVELYGVQSHERGNGAYSHTSLVTEAEQHIQNPLLKGKLIIGNAPETLLLYNGQTKQYELICRYTYATLLQLPRFFDVLYYFSPENK